MVCFRTAPKRVNCLFQCKRFRGNNASITISTVSESKSIWQSDASPCSGAPKASTVTPSRLIRNTFLSTCRVPNTQAITSHAKYMVGEANSLAGTPSYEVARKENLNGKSAHQKTSSQPKPLAGICLLGQSVISCTTEKTRPKIALAKTS